MKKLIGIMACMTAGFFISEFTLAGITLTDASIESVLRDSYFACFGAGLWNWLK